MALVLADRVQETSTSIGTGSFTLAGAVTGYQTFAVIGNGNTTFYTIADQGGANWEVGIGTYSTTGPTLARTTVLSNSNGNTSPVNFTAGTKTVFVTYPSEQSVNLNASGNVSALGNVTSGVWQGTTVGVAYGGTGVTSSSGANSVMLRDANQNVAVNRLNQSNTSTTAAGGVTALTTASSYIHTLAGTGDQTYTMPDATTLSTGVAFLFNNMATGTLTLQNFASGAIGTIPSGGAGAVFLTINATVGGTWDLHSYLPEGVTWGTNALNMGSTVVTGGTWQGGTIQPAYGGTGLTTFTGANNALYSTGSSTLTAGTLPVPAGGTGVTSATANGLVYGNGTSALQITAAGTTGQVLLGNTGSAPSWGSVPAGSITGTVPIANGGTGQTTAAAAFNALSPITTTGDLIVGNGSNSATRLGIGSTGQVLTVSGGTTVWSTPATGGGTITRTDFTATAGQTVFTVSYTVGLIDVYRNGVKLATSDFTATNGTSFTLAVAANAGDIVQAVVFSSLNLYSTITYQVFNGTGSQTVFTMSSVPANSASLLVAISGVVQDPGTYTVSSTTLTFLTAPPAGTGNISVRYLGIASVGTVGSFSAGTTGLTPSSATTGAVVLAGTLNVANGGTGLNTLASSRIPYGNGTGALASSSTFVFDGTNLGIGTTTPTEKLELFSSGTVYGKVRTTSGGAGIIFQRDNSATTTWLVGHGAASANANFEIFTAGAGDVSVQTNGSERMRIVGSSGRVGLGTSSPLERLDSRGAAVFSGDNATGTNAFGTAAGILLSTASDNSVARVTAVSNGNNSVGLSLRSLSSGSAVEGIRIDSSGNVGIGTTSPASRLNVFGTSTAPSATTLSAATLNVQGSSTLRLLIGTDPSSPFGAWLQTTDGAGAGYPINLNPLGGNVGIGTSNPGYKLQISGVGTGVTSRMGITNTTTGSTLEVGSDGNGGFLATSGSYGTLFYTNGTERGRFDSSGNFLFNSGYGSAATAYGSRAWVNFNGTGTVAIRGSGNVSSISDNGTGDYTVNFTTAMPDANYAVGTGLSFDNNGSSNGTYAYVYNLATGSFRTQTRGYFGGLTAASLNDSLTVTFVVSR